MKILKENKIIPKTREQIEQEMDNVFNKKDNSSRAKMLRKAAWSLRFLKTQDEIKKLFVEEYIRKYGELVDGKKTLEQLKEQSIKDGKLAEKGL